MAADDSAPVAPEGQSKSSRSNSERPALDRRASDHSETANASSGNNLNLNASNSNASSTTINTSSAAAPPRAAVKHPKQRRVGMHGRVPSSTKSLHKQHANASKVNLSRRQASPVDLESPTAASSSQHGQRPAAPHRRATSELRLSRNASAGNVAGKPPAQPGLKRNRSHVEVAKRSKSSEKLKRSLSGTGISQLGAGGHKSSKSQVHFDLGSDDHEDDDDDGNDGNGHDAVDDDEWVDASGSNSPFLSRKGSINSSTHSSAKPSGSASSSRPHTPPDPDMDHLDPKRGGEAPAPRPPPPNIHPHPHLHSDPTAPSSASVSEEERRLTLHKELLTSKLLQRSASSAHVVPPKMTADTVQAGGLSRASPASTEHDPTPPPTRSREDGLTSRFVEGPGSGAPSEAIFFHGARGSTITTTTATTTTTTTTTTASTAHRPDEATTPAPRRSHSASHFPRPQDLPQAASAPQNDNSALVPRAAKHPSAPAEASRTQQKLNLQRASSTLEPGQAVVGGVVSVIGANPLIGVGDAGHDGGHSRDPRVGKLLERHGMEYLVVRRYQNPIARSLQRLSRLPSLEKAQRIVSRTNTASTVASRRSVEVPTRSTPHARITSTSISETAAPMRRSASVRTNGGSVANFDGEGERLSGSSLVVREEEDGVAALLRNLWEKPLDLSASTD